MKTAIVALIALTAACFGIPALTQGDRAEAHQQEQLGVQNDDADKLYALVKEARADLREMRKQAGLHAHPAGPHVDPQGHHANDSAAQRERERGEKAGHEDGGGEGGHEGRERDEHSGREGRGEHGEGHEGRERGEHGGRETSHGEGEKDNNRIAKGTQHDKVYRNGARLILQYNPNTQAFVGSVQNTTKKSLSQVRIEIHLSNGLELGPTMRVDLKAGATIPVELSALDQEFTSWVTHPEAGVEKGHGPGGEESEGHAARESGEHGGEGRDEGRGEHGGEGGGGGGNRPGAAFRPVHNQLQLLRGEMMAFKADLADKKKEK
jgi:hypothetical protein